MERGGKRDILPRAVDPATDATATIASVSDQDWYISRTHGVYHIPVCGKGQVCSLLLITSRGDALDLGDNRRFPFTISAREIAEDLLQDLQDHGVFVCARARPNEQELGAAVARRDAFYHRLVADGDTLWARGHSFREISDLHRRAAIALGIEREWAYVPTRMKDCPACGEKVKEGVAVCRHCHAILNEETAAKHGITMPRSREGASEVARGAEGASHAPNANNGPNARPDRFANSDAGVNPRK